MIFIAIPGVLELYIFRHHELVAIERFHEPACTYLRFIYYYYYCYRWYCVITYKCSRRSSHRNSRSVNSNERTRATNESVGQAHCFFLPSPSSRRYKIIDKIGSRMGSILESLCRRKKISIIIDCLEMEECSSG